MTQLRELVKGLKEEQASDKRKIVSLQEELKEVLKSSAAAFSVSK